MRGRPYVMDFHVTSMANLLEHHTVRIRRAIVLMWPLFARDVATHFFFVVIGTMCGGLAGAAALFHARSG